MKAIRVRTKVESDTLHLPELTPFIGKPVEVFIVELPLATREEFYSEIAFAPLSGEELAAEQVKLRAWRADPRFERFWPTIDRFLGAEQGEVQADGTPVGQKELAG